MNLSLVDISVVPYGGDRKQALKNTIETAKFIEDLDYKRFWVAEHHNMQGAAGRTPEVMIAAIAENTQKIHVGSGAVLLNHYSPYKVAEVFGTLSELYPSRIDLGRATTGQYSDLALQRIRSTRQNNDDSEVQIDELLHWIGNDFPKGHPFNGNIQVFNDGPIQDVYLLGSSGFSAQIAAKYGLAYNFAAFINADNIYPIVKSYLDNFRPSEKPYGQTSAKLILSLAVYVQENDELALEFGAPTQYLMRQMYAGGKPIRLTPEKEALAKLGGSMMAERLKEPLHPPRYMVGNVKTVAEELKLVKEAYGADEIMFYLVSANQKGKLKSLELLAKQLGN